MHFFNGCVFVCTFTCIPSLHIAWLITDMHGVAHFSVSGWSCMLQCHRVFDCVLLFVLALLVEVKIRL